MANLSGATLHRANLSKADFSGADLIRTNLRDANLAKADLSGATCRVVDFSGANLREAKLTRTDLSGANLARSDLRQAELIRTNLTQTNCREADFHDAYLAEVILGDTDLTAAKGLDACEYGAPSTVDHRTLAKSGRLPLQFLRGCGLPDALIDYLPSLLSEPIQFYSCFISYSHQDEAFAQRLHADLQNKGVRCWYAAEDMKIGDRIRDTIDQQIRLRDKLLVVLSSTSIESEWVEDEVEAALEEERKIQGRRTVLFPIKIDNAIEDTNRAWARKIKRTCHIGDFTRWKDHDAYQTAFNRLLHDLKADSRIHAP